MVTFHSIVPISISNATGNRELHYLGEQGYFRGFSLQSTLHILLSTSIVDCSTALLKNALLAPLKHAPLALMKKKIRLLHWNHWKNCTASPVPLKKISGCHWKNWTAPLALLKNALLVPLKQLCWHCWKKKPNWWKNRTASPVPLKKIGRHH